MDESFVAVDMALGTSIRHQNLQIDTAHAIIGKDETMIFSEMDNRCF